MRSWKAHSIPMPRLLILAVDSSQYSLNSLRILSKAPRNPWIPLTSWLPVKHFYSILWVPLFLTSSVPTRHCLLLTYPTSCLATCFPSPPQNFIEVDHTNLLASNPTINCRLNLCSLNCAYYCHLFLGLIVMVGWISLIGREERLA